MKAIEAIELTKYYGKARGIKNVTFSVETGETFGFIGPNGAGKSTTIRTLLGLISPKSGHASVLGMDIGTRRNDILKQVGYMPSEAAFWHGMTAGEVIKMSASLRRQDCSKEAARLMNALEIQEKRKVEQLSLGNKKKVGIVCALQHMPALYILDEPTSGLDPLMQRVFFGLLEERAKKGATIFLSSHVLSEVARYCSRAAIIKDGQIIRCAPVSELAHTRVRRVTLRGAKDAPVLTGLKDVHITEKAVSFLYTGRADTLIEALKGQPLSDMTITEPELDEIVMHYYEGAREE